MQGRVVARPHPDIAVGTSPTGRTGAVKLVSHLDAGGTIRARSLPVAPVNKALASLTGKAKRTVAPKGTEVIITGAIVKTRIQVTWTNPMLAVGTTKSWRTSAADGIDAIDASATVKTRTTQVTNKQLRNPGNRCRKGKVKVTCLFTRLYRNSSER